MTPEQEQPIRGIICDKCPEQMKLDFALWNRGAVAILIEREYGLKLSMISTVTNRGKARWMIIDENFNADKLIEFMDALTRDCGKKYF